MLTEWIKILEHLYKELEILGVPNVYDAESLEYLTGHPRKSLAKVVYEQVQHTLAIYEILKHFQSNQDDSVLYESFINTFPIAYFKPFEEYF